MIATTLAQVRVHKDVMELATAIVLMLVRAQVTKAVMMLVRPVMDHVRGLVQSDVLVYVAQIVIVPLHQKNVIQ